MPERAQVLRQPAAVVVADVDRGRRPLALDEEPALRVEVALEGSVEVEMILAEVGEGEGAEANAVEPAQLGTVGGRLERAAPIACAEHLTEGALEVDRLGRRTECRSEEHTSELQSRRDLVCRLLLEKKKAIPTCQAPCTSKTARKGTRL